MAHIRVVEVSGRVGFVFCLRHWTVRFPTDEAQIVAGGAHLEVFVHYPIELSQRPLSALLFHLH